MTPNEIKAFAAKFNMDRLYAGKKVLVKAPADKGGLYLSAKGQFDAEREYARRFDYSADKVGEQVYTLALNGMQIEIELAGGEKIADESNG